MVQLNIRNVRSLDRYGWRICSIRDGIGVFHYGLANLVSYFPALSVGGHASVSVRSAGKHAVI